MSRVDPAKSNGARGWLDAWLASPPSKKAIDVVSVLFVLSASILLAAMVLGDRFSGSLETLGLYNSPRGAFADCARPENASVKYCQDMKVRRQPRDTVGGKVLFSLSD